jgi:MFS family permease
MTSTAPIPAGQAWRFVILLALANTLSFIDRLLPSILLEPLRHDLDLSDTQIGLVQGLPFALFYTAFGLYFGRLADRGDRMRLVAFGLIVWSLATAATALSEGFWSLFGLRTFVAIGEAVLAPAAYSLIAALFVANRLGRALSVYQIGIYLGSGLALILGGAIAGAMSDGGWRMAFAVVGPPGILLALFFIFNRDPARDRTQAAPAPVPWNAIRFSRSHIIHFAAFSLIGICAYAVTSWFPTVLIRLHGVTLFDAGLWLGSILLVFGPLGVLTSGWLADSGQSRGVNGSAFLVGAGGAILLAPAALAYAYAPTVGLALAAAVPLAFLASFPFGVAALSLQLMTVSATRGIMSSLYLLIFTIIGYGIGPVAVGLLNDRVYGGPMGIGASLATVCGLLAPVAAALLYWGRSQFEAETRRVSQA